MAKDAAELTNRDARTGRRGSQRGYTACDVGDVTPVWIRVQLLEREQEIHIALSKP